MAKSNINQKSIAKSLNLSVATVSKALSDSAEINSETRAKVVNMASQLGYKYMDRTKALEKGKSCLVGVLINSRSDEYYHSTYFAGMSEKCAKLNVSLVLNYFGTDDCENVLDPEYQPPVMREGKLAGLILVNRWPEHIVKHLAAQMPCVSIVYQFPGVGLDVVGSDDEGGMAILMDHLYQLGHRQIGFLGRSSGVAWSYGRYGAYVESLYRLGLEFEPERVCDVLPGHLEGAENVGLNESIDYIAKQIQKGVRAWMCVNDSIGYLLSRGLMDRGFKIPQDVSITGFGGSEKNGFGCPPLTTMKVPTLKIGAEALRRLMTRLRHPQSPQLNVKLECKFVKAITPVPPSGG